MVNKPMIGVATAVAIVVVGTFFYLAKRHAAVPPAPVLGAMQSPASAELPQEPAIQHPLPLAQENSSVKESLPALVDSDSALASSLEALIGAAAAQDYLVPENIIRHWVVTIDNLPRQKVAVEKRPIRPITGSFVADGDELHATLDSKNFARYQPMVSVLSNLDMRQVTALYIHFYPLFQQAYQDLGYPNGYFNDRLVQVIDDLLATPQPIGPIELIRPNVMYNFADPTLEARSAGQKLLLRMGSENSAAIKTKLMELRAAITAAPPKR